MAVCALENTNKMSSQCNCFARLHTQIEANKGHRHQLPVPQLCLKPRKKLLSWITAPEGSRSDSLPAIHHIDFFIVFFFPFFFLFFFYFARNTFAIYFCEISSVPVVVVVAICSRLLRQRCEISFLFFLSACVEWLLEGKFLPKEEERSKMGPIRVDPSLVWAGNERTRERQTLSWFVSRKKRQEESGGEYYEVESSLSTRRFRWLNYLSIRTRYNSSVLYCTVRSWARDLFLSRQKLRPQFSTDISLFFFLLFLDESHSYFIFHSLILSVPWMTLLRSPEAGE